MSDVLVTVSAASRSWTGRQARLSAAPPPLSIARFDRSPAASSSGSAAAGGAAAQSPALTVDVLEPGGVDRLSGLLSLPSLAARGPGAEPLGSLDTLRENPELRVFQQVLHHHGLTSVARRTQNCGSKFKAVRLIHDDGCSEDRSTPDRVPVKLVSNHCTVPGCPTCSAAVSKLRGAEIAARVLLRLAGLPPRLQRVHLLTLTTRSGLNAGETLTADSMRESAKRIRKMFRLLWRDLVKLEELKGSAGAISKVEFGGNGACHLHVLVIGVKFISNMWRKDGQAPWLRRKWMELGGGEQVWVNEVREWVKRHATNRKGARVTAASGLRGAIQEVSKYIAKPGHGGLRTVLVALTAVAMHGQRRWDSFGSLRLSKQERDERLKQFRWEPCPCCGSTWYEKGPWAVTPEAAVDAYANQLRDPQERPRGPPPSRARAIQNVREGLARLRYRGCPSELRQEARAKLVQVVGLVERGSMTRPEALREVNRVRARAGMSPIINL